MILKTVVVKDTHTHTHTPIFHLSKFCFRLLVRLLVVLQPPPPPPSPSLPRYFIPWPFPVIPLSITPLILILNWSNTTLAPRRLQAPAHTIHPWNSLTNQGSCPPPSWPSLQPCHVIPATGVGDAPFKLHIFLPVWCLPSSLPLIFLSTSSPLTPPNLLPCRLESHHSNLTVTALPPPSHDSRHWIINWWITTHPSLLLPNFQVIACCWMEGEKEEVEPPS